MFPLLFLTFLPFLTSQPASPPLWPSQFEQNFTEVFTYPVVGSASTKGKFFYDITNKRYRIDRENGKWDRYCGTGYWFRNTACSQIVVEGKRFLYYPEYDYCCYCCDSAHGCGILRRDWLNNATFVGFETDEMGQNFEKWDKQGLQHNYYYATADEKRIMGKIEQQPNDIQTFDVNSFFEGIRDPSVLELPDVCKSASTCNVLSTCTAVRNS